MKIMVTGQSGMLGREVHKAVERVGHSAQIENIDITKEVLVKDCCPEVVINCAGLVPQRNPPPTPAEMMRVNGYGPWNLADWCDQIGARLIQVSTDCVFDGIRTGPHLEYDIPRPINSYGKSKLAGEVTDDPHLTIRTSFVGFGKHGLIAELKRHTDDIPSYGASEKLLWTGHTVRFVAEALMMIVERNITGLLHVPGETLTRFELVSSLYETLDLGNLRYTRSTYPDFDRRLNSERWTRNGLPDLPSFKWQLEWLRRSQ